MAVAKGYKKNPSLTICFYAPQTEKRFSSLMILPVSSTMQHTLLFTYCKSPSLKKTLGYFRNLSAAQQVWWTKWWASFPNGKPLMSMEISSKNVSNSPYFSTTATVPLLPWTRGTMALRFSLDSSVRKSVAANKSFSNLAISSCTNQGLQLVAKKSEKKWDDQGF